MVDSPDQSARIEVDVGLAVAGERWNARFLVPSEPCRLVALMPVLQAFTDSMVAAAKQRIEAAGERVSCRAGCGACCRQLVPIAQSEAEAIRELVDAMPEPRRSAVRARFANAVNKLREAGFLEALSAPETTPDDVLRPIGRQYFALQIPCPFLEDESCSIHPDRPLACREYLVTNAHRYCANPTAETIRCVPMPASVSKALANVGPRPGARMANWTFLVLALEIESTETEEPRPAPEILRELFQHLSKKGVRDDRTDRRP